MSSRAHLRSLPFIGLVIASLSLTACAGSRFGDGSLSPSLAPSATTQASVPASATETPPTSAVPSTEPSPDLGPFSCDFPIERRGEPVHAQLVDVRVGEHDGFDRVVFEFDNGLPEYVIDRADPPYTEDPSGLPMDVSGASVLKVALIGGTRWDTEYEATYGGPLSFEPGFDRLVQLVESGDFEAVSSWYIGLSEASCLRVVALDDPDRLVIDIAH